MKVVLRQAGIGLYYAGRKHWASNPAVALDLETIERATELSRHEPFREMEIHVTYDDPVCDLVLRLGRKRGPAA
jgi:L-rhamnose isomerase